VRCADAAPEENARRHRGCRHQRPGGSELSAAVRLPGHDDRARHASRRCMRACHRGCFACRTAGGISEHCCASRQVPRASGRTRRRQLPHDSSGEARGLPQRCAMQLSRWASSMWAARSCCRSTHRRASRRRCARGSELRRHRPQRRRLANRQRRRRAQRRRAQK
jgi:hypothetical protein